MVLPASAHMSRSPSESESSPRRLRTGFLPFLASTKDILDLEFCLLILILNFDFELDLYTPGAEDYRLLYFFIDTLKTREDWYLVGETVRLILKSFSDYLVCPL